MAAKTKFNCVR